MLESIAVVSMNNRKCSIPCNLCGSSDIDELSLLDRNKNYLRTVICKNCGLVWTDPRPDKENTKNFYSKDYRLQYKNTYKPKLKHVYRAGKVAISRYEKIKNIVKKNETVLDIGAGGGELLYLLRKTGCEVRGIEPNEGYARYSIEEYKLPIHVGLVQDFELPENTFSIVTMFHVLEHINNPFSIMLKIHKLIQNNGFLVVEVPNVEAICQAPTHRFHFAHFYNFNPETLETLGRKSGFKVYKTSVSSDGGNITAIFQKINEIDKISVNIPKNYEKIVTILRKHTNLSHFTSFYPYLRLLKKTFKAIDEQMMTKKFKTGKDILDFILNKNSATH